MLPKLFSILEKQIWAGKFAAQQFGQVTFVAKLLKFNKVKPTTTKENVQVTQVHGSIERREILEKIADSIEKIAFSSRVFQSKTCTTKSPWKWLKCHGILKFVMCKRVQHYDDASKWKQKWCLKKMMTQKVIRAFPVLQRWRKMTMIFTKLMLIMYD